MRRRAFLLATGATTIAGSALAGCLGQLGLRTQSAWRDPPLVENRPQAVYYPAITEGMAMYGMTTAGPYNVALMYSYPHRFWPVSGEETEKIVVKPDDSVHLMATIWDAQSGTVIPINAGLSAEITQNGELVSEEVIYPMLSQQMGFHYGANFPLDGDGTYTAEVSIGGTQMNRTDRFAGQFGKPVTATFEFEFRSKELYDLPLRRLPDKQGKRGAVPPMEMEMDVPVGKAPTKGALPGTALGTRRSGDAQFILCATSGRSEQRGTNGSTRLAAFPRTPYNRIVLPFMSLSATVSRDGERVFREPLETTLSPNFGYHYTALVGNLRPDDDVTLTVETPPQVARHDGYETAFLDMPKMRFSPLDSRRT